VFAINGSQPEQQAVRSAEGDWHQVLDLLAAVEPVPGPPLAALLTDESNAVARSLELTVVTASLPARLVEKLAERALSSGNVALVLVDASSFAGAAPKPIPELLRLQASGVAIAVLRNGDDLAERLGAAQATEAAHG
jgi:hypothetical protein